MQQQAQSSFMLMETKLLIYKLFCNTQISICLEIDLWLWRTKENKKLVRAEMPIPNYNTSLYCDKFQSIMNP